MLIIQKKCVPLHAILEKSGCSAVGSALRSGRRGRAFESPHPDLQVKKKQKVIDDSITFSCVCIFIT